MSLQQEGVVVCVGKQKMVHSKDKTKSRPSTDLVVSPDLGQEYPDFLVFNAFGEKKQDTLKGITRGDNVIVHYNGRCRNMPDNLIDVPADHRFFGNLDIWRVEKTTKDPMGGDTDVASDDALPF